ncbi:MAG: alpha/beta hydrolase-fold protein [Clostridia bacterium]|nr:alpha/beta hydrolase-fold protein [Clostridia bacterium]
MRRNTVLQLAATIAVALLASVAVSAAGLPAPAGPGTLQFRISFPAEANPGPLDGRVFVIISKDAGSEPKDDVDVTGVPLWGKEISGAMPGQIMTISSGDPDVDGYPIADISGIPAGDYFVQAFFTIYTTYHRADGHTVKLPASTGGGGPLAMFSTPGNLKSKAEKMHIDPASKAPVNLSLSQAMPGLPAEGSGQVAQQGNYADTDMVKYVKIQSKLLSDFWGQPMYIGANILLPRTYASHPEAHYPVWYQQGHWPGGRPPLRYGQGRSIDKFWASEQCPQMIVVEIRDENPYYDTSYSINSANLGPYGDAIMTELIPYIESNFRAIPQAWARLLSGGSTGGWEALALQVWRPDSFGGTWPLCPDSGDFSYFQLINIYKDANAYYTEYEWTQVERPSARATDGNIKFTVKQENDWERALGPGNKSGGQWSVWEAVYGPVGPDGYPARIWDPITGVINKDVAAFWKENFDIRYKLEKEWATIGPKLVGKIHIRVGDMDNYYLNNGVYKIQEFLEATKDPYYDGCVKCFPRLGHTGNITNEELLAEMAEHLTKHAPEGALGTLWLK